MGHEAIRAIEHVVFRSNITSLLILRRYILLGLAPAEMEVGVVCTDGTPGMLGLQSGFINKAKERNPSVVSGHCMLHREALASRTLPPELKHFLNVAIDAENCMKSEQLSFQASVYRYAI